jgi:SNF2 family DNA or RNA helicase
VRRADGSQRYGVFSYEQLTRLVVTPSETWLGLVTPNPPLLILDEAHYLKNPSALRTRAVLGAKENGKHPSAPPLPASRRIFMTGTPIINRPLDLWPMLEAMGTKMNYRQYGKRYCGGVLKPIQWSKARKVNGKYIPARPVKFAWDYTGASNLEELGNALRKHCMIRRLKKDVLKELPAKVRQVIEIDAPHGESATLRNAVSRMFNSLTEANSNTGELIKIAFEELSKARLELARHKLPHILTFLKDVLLEEEEKVVVFAHHREIIDAICADLYKSGIPCVKFDGGMNDRDKDASVQLFQHGLHRVFVGQIIAAGTGITLTAASTVLFAELDWVPGNVIQAEDRCHRIGQESTVRAFHIVMKDSADGRMVRALVTKQNTIEGVMG